MIYSILPSTAPTRRAPYYKCNGSSNCYDCISTIEVFLSLLQYNSSIDTESLITSINILDVIAAFKSTSNINSPISSIHSCGIIFQCTSTSIDSVYSYRYTIPSITPSFLQAIFYNDINSPIYPIKFDSIDLSCLSLDFLKKLGWVLHKRHARYIMGHCF